MWFCFNCAHPNEENRSRCKECNRPRLTHTKSDANGNLILGILIGIVIAGFFLTQTGSVGDETKAAVAEATATRDLR